MDNKKLSHNEFLERLTKVAETKLGINRYDRGFKHALAKALSARDSTVQRWFAKSYPEAEYLIKIYNAFGITPNALLSIKPDPTSARSGEKPLSPNIEFSTAIYGGINVEQSSFIIIPLIYCCGPQNLIEAQSIQGMEVEDWTIINRQEIPNGRTNLVSIRFCKKLEWSMFPIFRPLDIAIVDLDDKTIQPYHIYVVIFEDHPTVRRLQRIDENQILLIPENKGYEIKTASLKDTKSPIIGKVVCSISHY